MAQAVRICSEPRTLRRSGGWYFLLFDDALGGVKNAGVFQMDDAALRAGLYVGIDDGAVFKLFGAEVVADGLLFQAKFFGDSADAAGGELMFDSS